MRNAKVGEFVLDAEISNSPSGLVWRAHRASDGRAAVVKLIAAHAREDVVARFHREERMVSKLAGCRVPALLGGGVGGPWHFLAFEQIEGWALRRILEVEGALPAARAVPIFAGLLDVLAQVHARGIVHRDVKPDNVVVASSGALHLVDFGLAKYAEDLVEDDESSELLTTDDTLLGSLAYMAPDPAAGSATR